MSIRNITISGETLLNNVGHFACIKNKGADDVLVCAKQGLSAGNDGTLVVTAGESVIFPCSERSLVLRGNGEVTIIGSDTPVNFFKPSSAGGGATKEYVDSVRYAENLLINPDFAINQRGESSYSVTDYTADCWFSQSMFEVTPLENGIRIRCTEEITSNVFCLYQHVPITKSLNGSDFTLTANVASTNDYAYMVIYAYNAANSVVKSSEKISLQTGINSVTIKSLPETAAYIRVQFTINAGAQSNHSLEIAWAKLEAGSQRTKFNQVNVAAELLKCQQYYQIRSTGGIPAVDLRPVMAGTPKVTQRSDGNYAYTV